jgi:hypothetical protein
MNMDVYSGRNTNEVLGHPKGKKWTYEFIYETFREWKVYLNTVDQE